MPPPPRSLLLALILLATAERKQGRLSRLASRATGAVVDAVDPDAIIDHVDVDAIVQRIDIDALVDRIDIDALVRRIDVDALLAGIDFDALIKHVDLDAAMAGVDVNALLDRVEINDLLDGVDPDRLLDRVDPDRLLDRVGVDRMLDRVDVNRLMDRVDVNRLMDRADVEKIVVRAGIPEIVAESTSHLTGSLLDIVRRQLVALDEIVGRVIYRLTGRDPTERPVAPALLRGADGPSAVSTKGRAQVTGHYAGAITRLAAFAFDGFAVFGLFTLAAAALAFVATLFGLELEAAAVPRVVSAAIYAGWAFLYWWVGLALLGKTLGKGLVGLRVVSHDGHPLTARRALARTLSLPISFLLFGLGLLGIVFGRHRRALHDVIAGTCEVYDWGDRPADIPAPLTRWIERRVDAR
jgi:uncharacterized RDD family membrane protein YckC